MTQNKKIALTGGIGSGKSTAGALLREMGYPVFSSDEVYAQLTREQEFLALLEERFPGCTQDGTLDRKRLSATVFSDSEARKALNALAHPPILQRLLFLMKDFPVAFAEIPLLFESGCADEFDRVFVFTRDERARIESVKRRSGLSEEEILARIRSQYDYRTLPAHCTVIPNDGTVADLKARLVALLSTL